MRSRGKNSSMSRERERDLRRVQRLRTLGAQLERLPRSPARDRLLREVLHRAVAVDTGVPMMSCWGDQALQDPAELFDQMALGAFPRFAAER